MLVEKTTIAKPPIHDDPSIKTANPFVLASDTALGKSLMQIEHSKRVALIEAERVEAERVERLKALLSSQADQD